MVAVTADTNIWISAFNYRGNPRSLIEMAEAGKIQLAISDTIIEETRRILHERFEWAPDRIDMAEAEMHRIARHRLLRQHSHDYGVGFPLVRAA